MRSPILALICCFVLLSLSARPLFTAAQDANAPDQAGLRSLFAGTEGQWAERQLAQMSLEEKIGQLFMVPVYTNDQWKNFDKVKRQIRQYHLGGVIFMQGKPGRQAQAVHQLQRASKIPLLTAQDAEWGLAMRLDHTPAFPRNMQLGAVQDRSLIETYGQNLAQQCRRVGVNVNFAPVVDVNNNADNPVIHTRAFGAYPDLVAEKGQLVARGMQTCGVIATAKHFPGHGDTDIDSHKDLPVIPHDRARLDSVELQPFAELINSGVKAIMTAHVHVPALEPREHRPATLSRNIVHDVLRDSLGFDGLAFTDALNMGGVTKHYAPGEIEVEALKAGNDVLLFPQDVPKAVSAIKTALEEGELSEQALNQHVRRILWAKEWLGLDDSTYGRPPAPQALQDSLYNGRTMALREQLYKASITLVSNAQNTIPLEQLAKTKVAYVDMNRHTTSFFYKTLRKYGPVDYFEMAGGDGRDAVNGLSWKLKSYDVVILGAFGLEGGPSEDYGYTRNMGWLLDFLADQDNRVVVAAFGSPYILPSFEQAGTLLACYEEARPAQEAAAEAIYGGRPPAGRLPVLRERYHAQHIRYDRQIERIRFGHPEVMNVNADTLSKIDRIAKEYIRRRAMPGCVVLGMHKGQITYAEGFGEGTYKHSRAIDPYNTVYDVASVTKVAATALVAMRLYETGRLQLRAPLKRYLPELIGDPKGELTILQLMKHKTGLIPYVPFYKELNPHRHYSTVKTENYSIPIAKDLYLHDTVPGWVWQQILQLEPGEDKSVDYSDINVILLKAAMERILDEPLPQYLQREFYKPMGMDHTYFNPGLQAPANETYIPPTIEEHFFRHKRIQGYVNDPNAALLGGFGGHAGLFTNAYDLAKLAFMLQNGGRYGGKRYLSPTTINYFTTAHDTDSRRGLIWDKPEQDSAEITPVPPFTTFQAYGHLGYTGASFWNDPTHEISYIMLTNRTYPRPGRNLYGDESVRIQVMEVLYRAMEQAPLRKKAHRRPYFFTVH